MSALTETLEYTTMAGHRVKVTWAYAGDIIRAEIIDAADGRTRPHQPPERWWQNWRAPARWIPPPAFGRPAKARARKVTP